MTAELDRPLSPVVLAVRDLAAAAPGVMRPAVRDVTFTLRRGEWLAISGPNGAGKTTLALALAGLWPPLKGTRTVPVPDGGLRIATILQEPATQITQRSVVEEIAFTALNLGLGDRAAYREAVRWAERLGLTPLLERAPDTLSAGQQQKVLIAAALAAEPHLLIADEAAAHLDPELRRTVLTILRERVDAGLALIWVTQDPEETRCADRLIRVGIDGRCEERPSGPEDLTESHVGREEAFAAHSITATATVPRVLVRIVPDPQGRIAVSGPLSVAIGDQGVWAIAGPNGSGKTSVLEALAGVEPVRGMEIKWRESYPNRPILAGQFPERQIFQEHVRAEVSFAALRRGMPAGEIESRMTEMFRSLALPLDFPDRRTWELSTGEKRMVSLVATLLTPASLLLLDEPTCGLDPLRRNAIAGWVRGVCGRLPVVVASQDQVWIRQVGAIEVPLGMRDRRSERFSAQDAKFRQKTD